MIGTALEDFKSCLTKGKEYFIIAKDGQYVLIEEDNGRLVWNWIGIFYVEDLAMSPNGKMKINWNII